LVCVPEQEPEAANETDAVASALIERVVAPVMSVVCQRPTGDPGPLLLLLLHAALQAMRDANAIDSYV
jgi:hypothetical protein